MRSFALGSAVLLVAAAAHAGPANTLKELQNSVGSCMAKFQLHPGSAATVRFALNRSGGIIGTPRISYAKAADDQKAREDDAHTVDDALHACLPAKITDALGGAIAGHMFVYSFGYRKPRDV